MHKRKFFFNQITLVVLFSANIQAHDNVNPIKVGDLICEYKTNPISVSEAMPRLSWKIFSNIRNTKQIAYEIRVGTNQKLLGFNKELLWESGKINTDQSILVPYSGTKLISREKCFWQVRIWDNNKHVSPWSKINYWKMGFLNSQDWTAHWIETNNKSDTVGGPVAIFRKAIIIKHQIKSAYLYITARGVYEACINDKKISNDYFAPGFTSYNHRLQYQVYDVSQTLKKGGNALGVSLGDGWFRGYTYNRKKNVYGKKNGLLFQLEVVYVNGSYQVFTSDQSCKVSYGPIRASSFFDGEIYDARKEKENWATYKYNDKDWDSVYVNNNLIINLISTYGPPVIKHEKFEPQKITLTTKGDRIIDFGQNLVGWVQFHLKGRKGDTLKLFHAEVLDQKGNLYTQNLRTAKQEVTYIFKGENVETYEPHFTFQGFRYVEVRGYTGPIDSTNFAAYALYSDMKQTGAFSTSNKLINQLQHNILWGQKGNFIDIPTDCPQRDERMGWTGDAQAFCSTALFNMDGAGFFTKWLKDLTLDQRRDGAVPYVIPNVLDSTFVAAAGWSDVATIAPWNLYLAYGDKDILQQQYESMKAWVNYMKAHSHNFLWDTGYHFGDWLFYGGNEYENGPALTDKNLIAQTFYARSIQILINAASILGNNTDVKNYTQLLNNVKKAFLTEYVTPAGRLVSGTQTSYVLALNFDMLPDNLRAAAAKRLVQNIADYDGHLTTGFLGTPLICHVLTRFGYTNVAYELLLKETYPSWLYPVKNGATTIWERWDGIKPDKSFEDPGMNSFNHYAYGAIGDWMYRVVTGINTDEISPGYHKMIIAPHPGGKISSAQATLETPYGKVISAWSIADGFFTLDITIPSNTTAKVILPSVDSLITENNVNISDVTTISNIEQVGIGDVQLLTGSGSYHFVYKLRPPITLSILKYFILNTNK